MGLPWDLIPLGYVQKHCRGRHPGGILTRCLNGFNWLLLTQRSSSSTSSSPAYLWTHTPFRGNSLPRSHDHQWGLKSRWTGKLKASPLSSAFSLLQQSQNNHKDAGLICWSTSHSTFPSLIRSQDSWTPLSASLTRTHFPAEKHDLRLWKPAIFKVSENLFSQLAI